MPLFLALMTANLAVGDIAPLHGRIVPLAELQRTIGKNP